MITNEEQEQKQTQEQAGQTEILQMAIRCAKQGQRAVARTLLAQVCSREPNNESAWMWRASLAETADEGLVYLEQVLRLNPTNPKALAWLEKATAPLRPVPKTPVVSEAVAQVTPQQQPEVPVSAPPPQQPEPAPVASAIAEAPVVEEASAVQEAPVSAEELASAGGAKGVSTSTNNRLRSFLDSIAGSKAEAAATPPAAAPVLAAAQPVTEATPAPPPPPQERKEPTCPLCGSKILMESITHCPTCGGMTCERIPGDFARNTWIHRDAMEGALERLKKLADGTSFENEYWLAVAYMNLLETGEGVKQAQKAINLDPDDPRVEQVLRPYLARPRVLVVDDSTTIREVVIRTLEKKGYATAGSKNGLYALGDATDFKPVLVLLDIAMPVMDGYQVCSALKKNPATKHIPVVMLSGKDGIFDKVKGRMAGATEHISKPFKPEGLVKSVSRYAPAPIRQ
jgi:twitching motility two-component system response regulator PilG